MKYITFIFSSLFPLLLYSQNYEQRGDFLLAQAQYEKTIKQYLAAMKLCGDNPNLKAKLSKAKMLYELYDGKKKRFFLTRLANGNA